jgi:hypothetical protein
MLISFPIELDQAEIAGAVVDLQIKTGQKRFYRATFGVGAHG